MLPSFYPSILAKNERKGKGEEEKEVENKLYTIILLFSTVYNYKKKLGSDKNSFTISSFLFLSTFLNRFYLNLLLRTLISILLMMISLNYFI